MSEKETLDSAWLIFGPPGTGKTSFLAGSRKHHVIGQVERAADKYGAENVLVCSFTKAAAHEIGSRVEGLPKRNVGTLHSICFHALDCPDLTEGREQSFNEEHPHLAVTTTRKTVKKKKGEDDKEKDNADGGGSSPIDDPFQDGKTATRGDKLRELVDLYRVRRTPVEKWFDHARPFHEAWTDWKHKNDLMDFTDLLEFAVREFDGAPGNPAAIFYDEAQDASQLQADLLCKWGNGIQRLVLAGDDDQAIFFWAGADSRSFLDFPCDQENRRYLRQSHRLPREVHEKSLRWVKRLSRREEKQFDPRDADGFVRPCFASWPRPEDAVRIAEELIEDGQSVMFITACSYMLDPLKAVLRKRGVPFGNPWRTKRSDWNPLQSGGGTKTMPVDRLRAFLRPDPNTWDDYAGMWRRADAAAWLSPLAIDPHFRKGVKTGRMKEWKKDVREIDYAMMAETLSGPTLARWDDLGFDSHEQCVDSVSWWLSAMPEPERRKIEYHARVFETRGSEALVRRPLITIGTGHSLKGAEADVVFVFPDLSRQGWKGWLTDRDEHDGIVRLFYVMMTRARDGLYLCRPNTVQNVSLSG